ncbi:MAG: ABC transporter substrate-binding protein, partial [Pseudomonadota bacterium]
INGALYNGQFARTESFFARSDLAFHGHTATEQERAWLGAFDTKVKPAALAGDLAQPDGNGTGRDRGRLREALSLFRKAGYVIKAGRLVKEDAPDQQLAFEFLALTKAQERLMLAYQTILKRLGIEVTIRQVDNSQYWARLKTFDFDMIQFRWSASLSPGNEQIGRWSTKAADIEGALNFAGVRNAAADAMINKLLAARDRSDFTDAVRAFDRVLISGDYVVPLFHAPGLWLARWARVKRPDAKVLSGTDINTWWVANAQ